MSLFHKITDLQKLSMAWDHVRKNKPACGVDNKSWEEFEDQKKAELHQLHLELAEHRYESLPVRQQAIYRGEKVRTITLFSMRDKVVQQSLANELGKLYEPSFSECAYAYRPGKSALMALELIEKEVQKEGVWVLKLDIADFFDNINHGRLLQKLQTKIREEDVLAIVKTVLQAAVLEDKSGELRKNTRGVFQGATSAPIFSNIYLMEFDQEMEKQCSFYVRYSDDILILEKSEERARRLYEFAGLLLQREGLSFKEEKTALHRLSAEEGFTYLGYSFTSLGKVIPTKAMETLQSRLETAWLTGGPEMTVKLKKCQEILGGWEQYYRDKHAIGSMIEFVTLLSMVKNKPKEVRLHIEEQRLTVQNDYKDIATYMAQYWREYHRGWWSLFEYEQYFGLEQAQDCLSEEGADYGGDIIEDNLGADVADNRESSPASYRARVLEELLLQYEELLISPREEIYGEIVQLYTDLGFYEKASFFWEKQQEFADTKRNTPPVLVNADGENVPVETLELTSYQKLFVGREDTYVSETLQEGGRRVSNQVMEPLTEEALQKHLTGRDILGTYVQRPNQTAKFLVFDVDVSKKVLLQHPYGSTHFASYKQKAAEAAMELLRIYKNMGVKGYLEDTGFRGYHVWLFFTEWIPVRYINQLTECVQRLLPTDVTSDNDVTMEVFPNKARIKPGKCGQCIKMPLGVHIRSGERSFFIEEGGEIVRDYKEFLSGISKVSLQAVRKILGANLPQEISNSQPSQNIVVDEKRLGSVSESIRIVIERCSLMRFLIHKVMSTGYLSHFERQTLLYVFGHMGDEGKDFVHTLMSFTLNYQYHVTQKFITKMPEKPISCLKLREQYKMVTAEYGCSCSFHKTKNCYPSPVLHAIKNSDENRSQITVPTSRTITKAKEELVYEEINIHKQTQKLAQQIVDLKRQRNGLDKSIRKLNQELGRIFDHAGIDCLEIEMGLLVRRKKGGGEYEWLIEI